MIHITWQKCWRMWCFHAETAYPKKSSFPSPLCFSKLPLFRSLSKENVYLLWQRTTYQQGNPQSAIFHPWDQYKQRRRRRRVEELRFQQKSRHPSTKAGRADPRWEDRDRRSSSEKHAQTGWRQLLAWQRSLGTQVTEPHEEIELNKAWNTFSDRLLTRVTETGPYWAIMWVMQRVSNFHVSKKKKRSAHYAWNPNVESSSSRQRFEMPVLSFHQPCLDSG